MIMTPTHLAGHLTPAFRFKLFVTFADYVLCMPYDFRRWSSPYTQTSRQPAYDNVKREVSIDSDTIVAETICFNDGKVTMKAEYVSV